MKEFLELLRQSEHFRIVMDDVKKQRPEVPLHNYAPDNTEEWKALSNQQRGFDFALSLFGERDE
ncbi:MAG: hypothetical protein ACR2QW_11460 [bacterium]